MKLSVIIPAYNEAQNLKKGVLDEVDSFLRGEKFEYEVLIVDDGSRDGTLEIVEKQIRNKKNFRLIENQHGGKAIAVMTGLLKSKGDVALFTDMDQATPIGEIDKLLPKFEEGIDVVIGSRSGRKGAPPIRKLMAFGFSVLRIGILGLPYRDTQCGFKAFSRKAVDEIFPTLLEIWQKRHTGGAAVNAGFDVEVLYFAKKKNLKVAEVPVTWHHVGSERVQAISDSLEAVKDILRIRLNSWFGKYK